MDVLVGIGATVAAALVIALLLGTGRLILQMRDMVRHESQPNGGQSMKDYMTRTAVALEAMTREQAAQRRVQEAQRLVQERQTQLLEGIHTDLRDHNELTSRMVGALIEVRDR